MFFSRYANTGFQGRMQRILALSVVLSGILCFGGCTNTADSVSETAQGTSYAGNSGDSTTSGPISISDFKLDTFITITIYDSQDESLLHGAVDLCDHYERIFSRTLPESELYRLNHRDSTAVQDHTWFISEDLASLLSSGLTWSEKTGGAFDITLAPLTSLWNFSSEEHSVPADQDIRKALSHCGAEGILLDDQKIYLPSPDTQFDLGALAKGYIADRIKDYLLENGVNSAIINLGGNVLCVGSKPDGRNGLKALSGKGTESSEDPFSGIPFHIGIQNPFDSSGDYLLSIAVEDQSVVTSGIYQRCFEKDGVLYHHILDPSTGYPFDNGLLSVSIVSDTSVEGDILSTSCFALGYEKGMAFIDSIPDIYAIFITSDYEVHYSEGLSEKYSIKRF